MYVNEELEKFISLREHYNSAVIGNLLNEIKRFYKKYNDKISRYTPRYRSAVETILSQFPITIREGLDGKMSFFISKKPVIEVAELEEALKKYIERFESIEYLDFLSEEKRNVVFVGPNGCGKTTLLRKLKRDTAGAKIHYYPADRVLLVSDHFQPKRAYDEFIKDLNDNYSNATNIDYSYQGTDIIKQFDYYINLLERERNEENEKKIVNGKTERIIQKWGELVKDRELFFEHGLCVRPINGEKYPLKYLSSGEKSILYFLVGILLQEKKDFYFIDEPENNLNPSIVSKLWDFIEKEMPDSNFVYLTHDSDFVASRVNAKIYWIEKYDGKRWIWKQLAENKELPKDLMIQLVGSREPVIFCESKDEYKLDAKLFKKMFPQFKVVAVSGCTQVETYVKAYKTLGLPHKVFGIIDCDYKDDEYLGSLTRKDIYHMPFLEIENFLFSEKIVKKMISVYSQEMYKGEVFPALFGEIKSLFIERKDEWIAKHVAFDMRNKFDYRGKIKPLKNLNSFKMLYNEERKSDEEIDVIAEGYEKQFNDIVSENNYNLFLRHLDYKGLMSQLNHIFRFTNNTNYEEAVFDMFNTLEGGDLLEELKNEYFPNISG